MDATPGRLSVSPCSFIVLFNIGLLLVRLRGYDTIRTTPFPLVTLLKTASHIAHSVGYALTNGRPALHDSRQPNSAYLETLL